MKRFVKLAIMLFFVSAFPFMANAQRWGRVEGAPVTVYSFTENVNTAPEVVNIFYTTQGEYFRDPLAPRFILVDREGKWALGIGGYVQARAEFDFNKIVDNIDFLPSDIQRGDGPSTQYQMDVTTSTLFVKLVGRSRLLGDFNIFTSGDWRGDGKTFHLLNAYLKNKYMTLGYTTGGFMDLAAYPATVDNAGPCGMTFYRATQFALNYGFDWGLSMGIGVESPDINATENEYVSVGAQRFPDIPIYFKYQFYKNTHVRVGAIMRDISYRNLVNGGQRQKVAWGAQASALVTIGDFHISGQYSLGEGIGSLINDVSNVGVDIVPTPDKPGDMMMLFTDAWFASLQYNISRSLFATATYSQSNLRSRNGFAGANPEMYKRGQYLVVNMFANLSENMQLGLEYLHGWRMDFDEHTYNANRINFSARYNF
ncbi:MAG: hypothetical protein IKD40_01580 [Bacteroidaceae bacterium]|nr:hypothetical protein [Bacteroidaceae bacterium]